MIFRRKKINPTHTISFCNFNIDLQFLILFTQENFLYQNGKQILSLWKMILNFLKAIRRWNEQFNINNINDIDIERAFIIDIIHCKNRKLLTQSTLLPYPRPYHLLRDFSMHKQYSKYNQKFKKYLMLIQ